MPADPFCAIASVRSRSPWVRTDRAKSEKGEAIGRCAPTQTELQKAKETASLTALSLVAFAAKPSPLPFFFSFFFSRPRQAITANIGRRLGLVIIGESDKPISPGGDRRHIPRSLI